jgi:hypothetical protein
MSLETSQCSRNNLPAVEYPMETERAGVKAAQCRTPTTSAEEGSTARCHPPVAVHSILLARAIMSTCENSPIFARADALPLPHFSQGRENNSGVAPAQQEHSLSSVVEPTTLH